jgi:hypothetical protein
VLHNPLLGFGLGMKATEDAWSAIRPRDFGPTQIELWINMKTATDRGKYRQAAGASSQV